MQTTPSNKMLLMIGPCIVEGEALTLEIAQELKTQLSDLNVEIFFKASFDKANRTSIHSFRGIGEDEAVKILQKVKQKTGLPLLTDFHSPDQALPLGEFIDYLQVPAFLCRQTEMIVAAVQAAQKWGCRVNVKKGQFLAPWDTKNIVEKARQTAKQGQAPKGNWLTITERGATHGYGSLVVDMISFQCIQNTGVPAIYDATHSIQTPGTASEGTSTGGNRQYLEVLARAAMAAGADGLFMEVHPDPAVAKSDGPNAFYLDKVRPFIQQILQIRETVQKMPKLLPEATAQ